MAPGGGLMKNFQSFELLLPLLGLGGKLGAAESSVTPEAAPSRSIGSSEALHMAGLPSQSFRSHYRRLKRNYLAVRSYRDYYIDTFSLS